MITLEELANKLINYRIKNNLTQQQLAKKINTSNKTICDIENQKETVRKITIAKINSKIEGEK